MHDRKSDVRNFHQIMQDSFISCYLCEETIRTAQIISVRRKQYDIFPSFFKYLAHTYEFFTLFSLFLELFSQIIMLSSSFFDFFCWNGITGQDYINNLYCFTVLPILTWKTHLAL